MALLIWSSFLCLADLFVTLQVFDDDLGLQLQLRRSIMAFGQALVLPTRSVISAHFKGSLDERTAREPAFGAQGCVSNSSGRAPFELTKKKCRKEEGWNPLSSLCSLCFTITQIPPEDFSGLICLIKFQSLSRTIIPIQLH